MSNRKITEDGKILLKIKEKIDTPRKWCKNTFHSNGRMCIKGALIHTTDGSSVYYKLANLAAYKMKFESEFCPIVRFNDAETTTHKDVMDFFDEAISKEIKGQ